MVASRYERTTPPYATYGPSDGRSWHEYFVDLKAMYRGEVIETVDEDGIRYVTAVEPKSEDDGEAGIPQVTIPMKIVSDLATSNAPGAVLTLCKSLVKNGWKWKLYHSQSFTEGKVYGPTAQKAGQKRDDKYIDVFLVRAYRGKRTLVVSYHSADGKATCNVRMMDGKLEAVSDKAMKEVINSDE